VYCTWHTQPAWRAAVPAAYGRRPGRGL